MVVGKIVRRPIADYSDNISFDEIFKRQKTVYWIDNKILANQHERLKSSFHMVTDDPLDHAYGPHSNTSMVYALSEDLLEYCYVLGLPPADGEVQKLLRLNRSIAVEGAVIYRKPASIYKVPRGLKEWERSKNVEEEWIKKEASLAVHRSKHNVLENESIYEMKNADEAEEIMRCKVMPMTKEYEKTAEEALKEVASTKLPDEGPAEFWLENANVWKKPFYLHCVDRGRNLTLNGKYQMLDAYLKKYVPNEAMVFGTLAEENGKLSLDVQAIKFGWGTYGVEAFFAKDVFFLGITPD